MNDYLTDDYEWYLPNDCGELIYIDWNDWVPIVGYHAD